MRRPWIPRVLSIPIGLAALAATPAVAAAPSGTGARAAAAPEPSAPRPSSGPSLSPVGPDVGAVPGLAASLVSPTTADGATLTVTNTGTSAVGLNVALVRSATGVVVRRWSTPPVAAGASQPITWDGTLAAGAPRRPGRFQFQVWTAPGSGTAGAARLSPTPLLADTVHVRAFAYPLDGRHDYGIGGEGRFGTGRSGHMHQGQDVFADCGTPVLAARAGTVQFAEFQSSAGNYVVVDGDGTDQDTAYMHLRDPALPAEGEHVDTGEVIGYVGDTGAASECHLHFELWDGPGWYEGGRPLDPLPFLRRWD